MRYVYLDLSLDKNKKKKIAEDIKSPLLLNGFSFETRSKTGELCSLGWTELCSLGWAFLLLLLMPLTVCHFNGVTYREIRFPSLEHFLVATKWLHMLSRDRPLSRNLPIVLETSLVHLNRIEDKKYFRKKFQFSHILKME